MLWFADKEDCFIRAPFVLCYWYRELELTITNCQPLSFRVIKGPVFVVRYRPWPVNGFRLGA